MTSSQVLDVIFQVGVYEDERLKVHHFDGDAQYLRDFVLPKVLAEREALRLRELARRDQLHAKRFHPIDDAALFEREGGAS